MKIDADLRMKMAQLDMTDKNTREKIEASAAQQRVDAALQADRAAVEANEDMDVL